MAVFGVLMALARQAALLPAAELLSAECLLMTERAEGESESREWGRRSK